MKPFIRPQFLHLLGFFVCFHVPPSPGISTTSAGSGDGTPSTATVKGRTLYNSGLPCHNIPRPWLICCSRVPSSPPPSNPLRRRLFGVLETRAMPTNHCIVTEECGVFVSTFHEKSPRIWSNFERKKHLDLTIQWRYICLTCSTSWTPLAWVVCVIWWWHPNTWLSATPTMAAFVHRQRLWRPFRIIWSGRFQELPKTTVFRAGGLMTVLPETSPIWMKIGWCLNPTSFWDVKMLIYHSLRKEWMFLSSPVTHPWWNCTCEGPNCPLSHLRMPFSILFKERRIVYNGVPIASCVP